VDDASTAGPEPAPEPVLAGEVMRIRRFPPTT